MSRSEWNCWKCGDQARMAEKTTLIGGYGARICVQCGNDWHEHVILTPAWKKVKEIDAKLAVSVELGDEQKTIDLNNRRDEVFQELYEIGKAWCPAPVAEPKPSESNKG